MYDTAGVNQYTWMDGSLVQWTNFADMEPKAESAQAVQINQNDGLWINVRHGHYGGGYICKKPSSKYCSAN